MTRDIPEAAPHPLVDAAGEGWLLWETRSPLVELTPAAVNLLTRARELGSRPILISDSRTSLTAPFAQVWRAAGASWVVRGSDGVREGFSGRRLTSPEDVISAGPIRAPDDVDLAFVDPLPPQALELTVIVSQRHRPTRTVSLGGGIDAIARAVGRPASAWGTHEPTGAAWNRTALTEFARARMPKDSFVVVTGTDWVSTVIVRRTSAGIEEVTTTVVDLGDPTPLAFRDLLDAMDAEFRELAARGMPLVGWASSRPVSDPRSVPPVLQAPPSPLRLFIGAPGVKALGLTPRALASRFDAEVVGRPRLPGILFRIGTLGDPTWERLDEILGTMDRTRLDEVLGLPGLSPAPGGDDALHP